MIESEHHLKGKLDWHWVIVSFFKEIFRASDLLKFIVRLDTFLKVLKSFSIFGIEIRGSVRNKRISSAKAANLYVRWAIVIPLISVFDLNRCKRGSRVSIKIKGHKGRVPLDIGKASDRWPFTLTLAVGGWV